MTADAPQPAEPEIDAADAPDEPVSNEDSAEAEIAQLKDKLLRARADYDNLVKRNQRDAALERERVKARVLESFLRLHEYAKMAEFEADRNPGPLAEGVKMVVREFDRLLEDEGVARIGTVGESFDASMHEAVAEEPGEVDPGQVSRIVQTGYRLGDRVLRYAKVAVAPAVVSEDGNKV